MSWTNSPPAYRYPSAELITEAAQIDPFNPAAGICRTFKYAEAARRYPIGDILQLESEPHVRLIGAVTIHGLGIGHALEWQYFHIHIKGLLKNGLDQAFVDGHNILFFNEGHLDIDLRELRLTVRTNVPVPEAFYNLAVVWSMPETISSCLKSCDDWGIELARIHTAGYQIVSGPLRCRLVQHRGFHFNKSVVVKVVPYNLGNLLPRKMSFLPHLGLPKVQISVFETQSLAGIVIIIDMDRGNVDSERIFRESAKISIRPVGILSLMDSEVERFPLLK